MSLHLLPQRNLRPLCKSKRLLSPNGLLLNKTNKNSDPDPVFYREVDMSGLPSQYTEEIETLRQILNFPDPRDSMHRSSNRA